VEATQVKKQVSILVTAGCEPLSGTFLLVTSVNRTERSVDGQFFCDDSTALQKIFDRGCFSVLTDSGGSDYLLKLLDGSGFFHLIK
jgi:hypothetical protein